MDSVDPRQDEHMKNAAELNEVMQKFSAELRDLIAATEGKIPVDMIYLQLSFWSRIMMDQLVNGSVVRPPDSQMN